MSLLHLSKPYFLDGMLATFGDVPNGARFATSSSRTLRTYVKVAPTTLPDGETVNAVVLLNHNDYPAEDLGAMMLFEDNLPVEVRTSRNPAPRW